MPANKVGVLEEDHPMYREGYAFTAVCSCGYASFGWPTKEQAQMRGDSHQDEHENTPLIRELLDSGDYEGANALMMPPKEDVVALSPDKFPVMKSPTDSDVNGAWGAVN